MANWQNGVLSNDVWGEKTMSGVKRWCLWCYLIMCG